MAQNYAPIIYYEKGEEHLPANVNWLLQRSQLKFHDVNCPGDDPTIADHPSVDDLWNQIRGPECGRISSFNAAGTYSKGKKRTYYLTDVAQKEGSRNSEDWVTYFQVYPRTGGGLIIQYWWTYAFNEGGPAGVADHGGDWEGAFLVFDQIPAPNDTRKPIQVRLTHHDEILRRGPGQVAWEGPGGTHPAVFASSTGHAMSESGGRDGIQHQTWDGGKVIWSTGTSLKPEGMGGPGPFTTNSGPLLNIGSKRYPLVWPGHDMSFIWYSGLWGSPGVTAFASGYVGPAYNNTEERPDGFKTAWYEDIIALQDRFIWVAGTQTRIREWFALDVGD